MFFGDVFDPFAKVRNHLKIKGNHVFTDNWIFLLHRKWSVILTVIALLIIFSYPAMIDQPIVCYGPSNDEVPKDFLDDWCWLSGTFIIPQHIGKPAGKEVIASGVGPDDLLYGTTKRLYNDQYMFYPIIFLFQLVSFYASKYIWKYLEGGRLKNLLSELTAAIVDDKTMKKRISLVTDYMTTSPATFHKKYSCHFIFCEIFNAVNVICQFWAIHKMLHGEFFGYGGNALTYLSVGRGASDRSTVVDPFIKLFPKLAICHFSKFGPSGGIIPQEAVCVLTLNNIADKIFLIWWFWLIFVGLMTTLGLVYRIVLLLSPCCRLRVIRVKTRKCDHADLKHFVEHSTYGDWFVLSLMRKNMDSWIFSQLVRELVVKMKETREKQL